VPCSFREIELRLSRAFVFLAGLFAVAGCADLIVADPYSLSFAGTVYQLDRETPSELRGGIYEFQTMDEADAFVARYKGHVKLCADAKVSISLVQRGHNDHSVPVTARGHFETVFVMDETVSVRGYIAHVDAPGRLPAEKTGEIGSHLRDGRVLVALLEEPGASDPPPK
jgi:hypothetical protein